MLRAVCPIHGRSLFKFHAGDKDGFAACGSSTLFCDAGPAHEVPAESRCKSKRCKELFELADAANTSKQEA